MLGRPATVRRTIFQEDWWLQLASRGRIETVRVGDPDGPGGSLSFMPTRRFGLRHLVMPPYTRTLGPVLTLPESGAFRRGQNVQHLVASLAARLPRHDYFHAALEPGDETPMAFSLAGFGLKQCFTFVIPATRPVDESWMRCDQKTRNLIRTARARYGIVESTDFTRFIAVSLAEHPRATNIHDFDLLSALFDAAVQRNCCKLLLAVEPGGKPISAVVLLVSGRTIYFWLSARDRSVPTGGANACLLWHGLEYAHSRGVAFDCDGYSSLAAAKFLASFGEPPVPRVEILHTSWRRDTADYARTTLLRGLALVRPRTRGEARSCNGRRIGHGQDEA